MNLFSKKWTKLEDKIIKAAVMKYGFNKWSKVASLLDGKTPEDCRNRWKSVTPTNTNFTKEELISLLDYYKVFPNQWNMIFKCMKNKSATQCEDAYNKIINDNIDLIEMNDSNDKFKINDLFEHKSEDENKNDVIEYVTARLKNNKGRKELKKERKNRK